MDDIIHNFSKKEKSLKRMIATKKWDTFNPLAAAAAIADESLWDWEQLHTDELIIDVPGHWGEYRFHLCWQEESRLFYLACFLNIKVPEPVPTELFELLVLVNGRLWMGHFDIVDNQWIVFRYALPFRSKGPKAVLPQIEELIDNTLGECEAFYPVFGNLLTYGMPPQDALQMGLIDTMGEA